MEKVLHRIENGHGKMSDMDLLVDVAKKIEGKTICPKVGAILAWDASRLTRSHADWHRLIEVCSLTGTLILDEDRVYDATDFHDGLLLGLKETTSAVELHVLRRRFQDEQWNKAERGQLRLPLPVGLSEDEEPTVLNSDPQV